MNRILLAIDVGNTNTKWGWFDNGRLVRTEKTKTAEAATACGAMLDAEPPCAVALSSVVPAATAVILDECRKRSREVVEVGPKTQTVFPDMHPEMGADRVADMVAAWTLYGKKGRRNVIVFGLGTASAMAALDCRKRVDRGGFIAPGVSLLMEILHQRTALLPNLDLDGADMELGTSTESQIKNGVLLTVTGMVRDWSATGRKTLRGKPLVIATGGWSSLLQHHDATLFDFVDPLLTLKGTYLVGMSQLAATASPSKPGK